MVEVDAPRRDERFGGIPLAEASRSAIEELVSRFRMREGIVVCVSVRRGLFSFGVSAIVSASSTCCVGAASDAC